MEHPILLHFISALKKLVSKTKDSFALEQLPFELTKDFEFKKKLGDACLEQNPDNQIEIINLVSSEKMET